MVPRPSRCIVQSIPSEPQISHGKASCSNTDLSTRIVILAFNDIGTFKYCLWYHVFRIASSFSLHCSLPLNLNFLLRILRQIYLLRAIRMYFMMRTKRRSCFTHFLCFSSAAFIICNIIEFSVTVKMYIRIFYVACDVTFQNTTWY